MVHCKQSSTRQIFGCHQLPNLVQKWQYWVQWSPILPVEIWDGFYNRICYFECDQAWIESFSFKLELLAMKLVMTLLCPQCPKSPKALPKISITNIFTNRVEFCVSDNAQLLPIMPTHSLHQKIESLSWDIWKQVKCQHNTISIPRSISDWWEAE